MKKNKFLIKRVRKQKYAFIIYNLVTYFIIFTVLGIVTMLAVDYFFYRGAKQELKEEAIRLEASNFVYKNRPPNYRKIIVFSNNEGKIIGGETETYIMLNLPKVDVRKVDNIRLEEATTKGLNKERHFYLTLLKRVNDYDNQYVKIHINVDGEVSSRDTILIVYTFCALTIVLLSIVASYFLSIKTIKPIVGSLEKQLNFVSDASHELRTPLAIVQSKIENILTDSEKTVFDVSEDLAISLKELNRLTKLTNDLLILARNDNENIALDFEVVDLDLLIKEVIEPFAELAALQDKPFSYQGVTLYTKGDRNKLYQVLLILLDNALAYTNDGDRIELILYEVNGEIILEVRDTGIGISEYTKNHLFERFYREDKARSRATGGNGLGLSIAQTLVQLHRGKIAVEHNEPSGAKFIITLPKYKIKD